MSIDQFIQRVCTQTAVYWGNPVKDGYGKYTSFDAAKEIDCRWVEKSELYMDNQGVERVCYAVVLVQEDMVEEGYLFLGTLNDLDSDQVLDPTLKDKAFLIKKFHKVPDLKGQDYVRKVYL